MTKNKYVIIESSGPISALGGLLGPIISPTYLDIKTVINIVNSGKVVYEVNPMNINDKIRLTFQNVLKDNFIKSTNKKQNVPKSQNVSLKTRHIECGSVHTNIIQETPNRTLVSDLFISNKHS